MGQKSSKKDSANGKSELSEELLDTYIQAEFKAMDTITDNDGTLLRQEVLDLLILLGYSKANKKLKQLHVKSEDSVELNDYFTAFKADKELIEKTMKFRKLFQMFDDNEDGTASKEEIIEGLEKIDIKVDKALKETIEKMDANDDGKITYQEFIAMELKIAMNKGKSKKEKKKDKKEKKPEEITKDSESSENQKENDRSVEEKGEEEKEKEKQEEKEMKVEKKEEDEKKEYEKKDEPEKIENDEKKDNVEK